MDKRGHERRKKSGADIINEIYGETPDAQLLVVGFVNCLRHGPYVEIGKYTLSIHDRLFYGTISATSERSNFGDFCRTEFFAVYFDVWLSMGDFIY